MPRIGLQVSFEVTAPEDVSPATLNAIEITTSSMIEQLEAKWNERLAQFKVEHPEVTICFGGEEIEDQL